MARMKHGVFSWEDVLAQRYQSQYYEFPVPLAASTGEGGKGSIIVIITFLPSFPQSGHTLELG